MFVFFFFFSSRRRHTRFDCDWSSDVCSSDLLRNAALRALGPLGDDKAVPLLEQWSAPGKPIDSRTAAIRSLASLEKSNQDITKQIAGYLSEPHFPVRMTAIFSLGGRGDAAAVPA